jgi:hypothetical protein
MGKADHQYGIDLFLGSIASRIGVNQPPPLGFQPGNF